MRVIRAHVIQAQRAHSFGEVRRENENSWASRAASRRPRDRAPGRSPTFCPLVPITERAASSPTFPGPAIRGATLGRRDGGESCRQFVHKAGFLEGIDQQLIKKRPKRRASSRSRRIFLKTCSQSPAPAGAGRALDGTPGPTSAPIEASTHQRNLASSDSEPGACSGSRGSDPGVAISTTGQFASSGAALPPVARADPERGPRWNRVVGVRTT